MPFTKPSVTTEWATQFTNAGGSGNPNKTEPPQNIKDFGAAEAFPTARQSINYVLDANHQWVNYFDLSIDDIYSTIGGVGTWTVETAALINTTASSSYVADTTSNNVDFQLPNSISAGEVFAFKHIIDTNNTCRVLNNNYTIKAISGYEISPTDNIILEKGSSIFLVARSASVLDAIIYGE